ncbi:MAG: hypothetical protein M3N56_10495 [Actinomycetota bacterium]|nr:hypothetical protein [Actinomycetota bacterium]
MTEETKTTRTRLPAHERIERDERLLQEARATLSAKLQKRAEKIVGDLNVLRMAATAAREPALADRCAAAAQELTGGASS